LFSRLTQSNQMQQVGQNRQSNGTQQPQRGQQTLQNLPPHQSAQLGRGMSQPPFSFFAPPGPQQQGRGMAPPFHYPMQTNNPFPSNSFQFPPPGLPSHIPNVKDIEKQMMYSNNSSANPSRHSPIESPQGHQGNFLPPRNSFFASLTAANQQKQQQQLHQQSAINQDPQMGGIDQMMARMRLMAQQREHTGIQGHMAVPGMPNHPQAFRTHPNSNPQGQFMQQQQPNNSQNSISLLNTLFSNHDNSNSSTDNSNATRNERAKEQRSAPIVISNSSEPTEEDENSDSFPAQRQNQNRGRRPPEDSSNSETEDSEPVVIRPPPPPDPNRTGIYLTKRSERILAKVDFFWIFFSYLFTFPIMVLIFFSFHN